MILTISIIKKVAALEQMLLHLFILFYFCVDLAYFEKLL